MTAEIKSHYCKLRNALLVLIGLCIVVLCLVKRNFRLDPPEFTPNPTSAPPGGILQIKVEFNPHGNDTLVVIHTQKTGGSEFLRHLVTVKKGGEYLCKIPSDLKENIKKRQRVPKKRKRSKRKTKQVSLCPRDPLHPEGEQWLIAEKTVRWVCGLHASYTEYTNCLPTLINPKINMKRKLHYAILLRHPVLRYLSEYFHTQRNATWVSQHLCGGRSVSEQEMPPCYPGYYEKRPWFNLTLSSFISCESNWGNNRQTMMLADLESVHCFNRSALSKAERERRLLETAKHNLVKFSFFGLTDYMSESCRLFEETFGMTFGVHPDTRNLSDLHSGPILLNLWNKSDLYDAILRANHLDVQLYEFALDLFAERAWSVGMSVNKDRVKQEVNLLRVRPELLDRAIEKYKKQDYRVS